MAPFITQLKQYIENLTLTRAFFIAMCIRALALVVVLWGMTGVLENPATWRFAGSDDGYSYFRYASTLLSEGKVVGEVMSLGFSLFLAPLIWLFQAHRLEDLMPALVIGNGVVLYALMAIALMHLSRTLGVSKLRAALSALLWLLYPFAFYVFFKLLAVQNAVIDSFTRSRFAQLSMFQAGMTDPLSAALIFSSLAIALHTLYVYTRPRLWGAVGALSGYATAIRSQYGLVPVFYGVFLLARRRWHELGWLILGGLPFAVIFALSNYLQHGGVAATGYEEVYAQDYQGLDLLKWQYALRLITYPLGYSPLLLVIMATGIAVVGYALWALYQRGRGMVVLIIGYLLATILPLLVIEPALRNPRYFLGVIPVLIVLSVEGSYYIYRYVIRHIRA